jgi:hypothetical protein
VETDELARELGRYEPPDIPLRLTREGRASRTEIVAYVRAVIGERTTVNDDTTAERLAQGITTSILSRLGAGYSIATGSAWIALVPAEPA